MRILFYSPPHASGSTYFRSTLVSRYLNKRGHETTVVKTPEPKVMLDYDIVVFQKCLLDDAYGLLNFVKSKRVKVVYDLDDDLKSVPSWIGVSSVYQRIGPYCSRFAGNADLCTYSTDALCTKYGGSNPIVLPNSFEFTERKPCTPTIRNWRRKLVPLDSIDRFSFRIGYWGSTSHASEFETVLPALSEFKKHENFVLLYVGTPSGETLRRLGDRVYIVDPVSVESYLDLLSSLKLYTALMPLIPCPFNECKSANKVIEAMILGIPPIASDFGEYRKTVTNELGYLCQSTQDWVDSLKHVADNTSYSTHLVEYAKSNHNIEYNITAWETAYNDLIG